MIGAVIRPILEGIFGSLSFLALIFYKNDYEIKKLKSKIVTRIILGGFVGYAWIQMGMPNHFNTLMAGALAPEVLDFFFEKFRDSYKNLK